MPISLRRQKLVYKTTNFSKTDKTNTSSPTTTDDTPPFNRYYFPYRTPSKPHRRLRKNHRKPRLNFINRLRKGGATHSQSMDSDSIPNRARIPPKKGDMKFVDDDGENIDDDESYYGPMVWRNAGHPSRHCQPGSLSPPPPRRRSSTSEFGRLGNSLPLDTPLHDLRRRRRSKSIEGMRAHSFPQHPRSLELPKSKNFEINLTKREAGAMPRFPIHDRLGGDLPPRPLQSLELPKRKDFDLDLTEREVRVKACTCTPERTNAPESGQEGNSLPLNELPSDHIRSRASSTETVREESYSPPRRLQVFELPKPQRKNSDEEPTACYPWSATSTDSYSASQELQGLELELSKPKRKNSNVESTARYPCRSAARRNSHSNSRPKKITSRRQEAELYTRDHRHRSGRFIETSYGEVAMDSDSEQDMYPCNIPNSPNIPQAPPPPPPSPPPSPSPSPSPSSSPSSSSFTRNPNDEDNNSNEQQQHPTVEEPLHSQETQHSQEMKQLHSRLSTLEKQHVNTNSTDNLYVIGSMMLIVLVFHITMGIIH